MNENCSISDYLNDLSDTLILCYNDLIDYEISKLQNNEKLDDFDLMIIEKLLLLSRKN